MTQNHAIQSEMQAIQKYSRSARGVVWAIMALIAAVWVLMFVYPIYKTGFGAGTPRFIWINLLYSLPVFILRIAALYQLEKLFRRYQKGLVFNLAGIRHIRLGGKLFLWSVAAEAAIRLFQAGIFLYRGASAMMIITMMQPMMGVGTALLIVGLLMLLVSRIMEAACRLSEEVELTV